MEDADARRVAKEDVMVGIHRITVSTVFLGFDHGFFDEAHLFETMTFGKPYDQILVARYATWAKAERGHQVAVKRLLKGYPPR